jgi:hypothetical protein
MTRLLLIVFMTALGFAAGYGVRIWTESHPALPPPPAPFLGEFTLRPIQGENPGGPVRPPPINRTELIERIQSIRQQLDSFQARKEAIEAQFDRDFDTILNPEQRVQHVEAIKRRHTLPAPTGRPLSDDELVYLLRDQPDRTVISDVVIPWRLDRLTEEYKLSDDQRTKVVVFLRARRKAFLELVDSSPTPSIRLYRLAPLVQRIAAPNEPQPAAAGATAPTAH